MNQSEIEHMAQGFPPSSIGKDHEEVVTFLATSLLAAQQKLDALAAENDRMKKSIKRIFPEGVGDEKGGIGFSDAAKECYASATETPSTDAYLNSVRADAIRQLSHEAQGYEEQFKRPLTNSEWSTLVANYHSSFDGLSRSSIGQEAK